MVLNAGFFAMMFWWFLRTPRNIAEPSSYVLLAVPLLCIYAVRLRPGRTLAVLAGVFACLLNLLLLIVTAVGSGISGRGEGEFMLVLLFTAGNGILVCTAWLLAFMKRD